MITFLHLQMKWGDTIINKKIINALLYVAFLSTFMCGCGNAYSTVDQDFRNRANEAGLSGSVITVMTSNDWIKEAEFEIATNFEAATGIQVIYDLYNDEQYLPTLFDRLESSQAPDVFLAQSGFAIDKTYHLDHYAVDLSNEPWIDRYDTFSATETSIDGKIYGMTYYDTTTDYYMVYNKKIFNSTGFTEIPDTYDEFLNLCHIILSKGIIPIYEPMADGWHQTMLFAENGQIFKKLEPDIIDKLNANETTFAENKNMKKALSQIYQLALNGYFGSSYTTDTYENAIDHLASGEYAMCMLKPGSINSIIESNLNKGYTKDDFGLMLLPICDNRILNIHPTGPSRFISNSSKNVEAAKLFFEYLTVEENIQFVINNSNETENLPFDAGQTPRYDTSTKEFLDKFDDDHRGLVLQDEVTYFNEQWGEISQNIMKMCSGEMTPEQVLKAIDVKRAELAIEADDPYWTEK